MIRENFNINLDEYTKMVEKDYPFLSHQEAKELVELLYKFLEEFYYLHIN